MLVVIYLCKGGGGGYRSVKRGVRRRRRMVGDVEIRDGGE